MITRLPNPPHPSRITRHTPARRLPDCLSVREAAAWLGIGRDLAYRMCKQGELPAVFLGSRIVIPRDHLIARLDPQRAGERG